MPTTAAESADFVKIDRDLQMLLECFREVLVELGEHAIAHNLPWQGADHAAAPYLPERTAQAYSISRFRYRANSVISWRIAARSRWKSRSAAFSVFS